jgi:DNA-binding transcriptional ArsR family regulator
MTSPQLFWDWGTAYDLFLSLQVLHNPASFGVRGAWAAGVRARLTATDRETLEQAQLVDCIPLSWIHSLPEPKGAASALWSLERVPPIQRLSTLFQAPGTQLEGVSGILGEVATRGKWTEEEREALRTDFQREYGHKGEEPPSPKELAEILDLWARAEEFGDRYLEALRAYHEAFFAEEERRIRPHLQEALSRARELAAQLTLPDLLEELSQGLRFEEWPTAPELVLVPSYWIAPLTYFGKLSEQRDALVFGARSPGVSLVPGEVVPDALLRVLKALSDPTRLRILHYLSEEPLTPSQLARRLRLRAPTVVHHLKTLRLAGLVQLTLANGKEKRRYAARSEAVKAAWDSLQGFLDQGGVEDPE